MMKTLYQLIKYFFVGFAASLVDYAAYFALTRLVALDAPLANPVAYVVGSLVSFLGHRTVTFHSRERPGYQYVKFSIVNFVGLCLSQLTLVVSIALGINDLIGKAASIVVSGGFNYLANRFWTFRME